MALVIDMETSSTFVLVSDGSAQVDLLDFRYTHSIATPLDRNFSFLMVVTQLQTKRTISNLQVG